MNRILKLAEPKLAILALLVFSGVLSITSYYQASSGVSGYQSGFETSPIDQIIKLVRYGIYASTILLIIARFKSIVLTAIRDPFLWILSGIALASFIWSDFPIISRKEAVLTLLTTLFGLYLASRYTLQELFHIICWAVGIAAVFSLLYTLALPGYGIEQGVHAGAWRGPLVHKNLFAKLAVICALPLYLMAKDSRKYRYVMWTVFGIAVALLFLSTSKTALVVFINLVIIVPVYKALRWSSSLGTPILLGVVLLGSSAGIWLTSNWESFLTSLGRDATLTGRTDIWAAVMEKIAERPWLGYGYGGFWQAGGGQDYVWHVVHFSVFTAHNGYLDLAADLGWLGVLCFVLSFITAYIRAIGWVRLSITSASLWPITYLTFIFFYNQSETTNIGTNSFFWVLYVATTLSLKWHHVREFDGVDEPIEILKEESILTS